MITDNQDLLSVQRKTEKLVFHVELCNKLREYISQKSNLFTDMFTSLSDTNYWRGEDEECKLFGTQCKGREDLEKDTVRSKKE
ncbi:9615_t:CDS:2, partial [Gigaspora rosea]